MIIKQKPFVTDVLLQCISRNEGEERTLSWCMDSAVGAWRVH